jgi:hypothetical protein
LPRRSKRKNEKHLVRLPAPHQEPFGPDDSLFVLTDKDFPELQQIPVPVDLDRKIAVGKMTVPAEEVVAVETYPEASGEAVRELLPSKIAKKVEKVVPKGFEVPEITITGEISGMPFGVGVSGQVSVTYTKSKP